MKNTRYIKARCRLSHVWIWIYLLLACGSVRGQLASLCAEVKMQISQEAALERQAFDAELNINNGLTGMDMQSIDLTLQIRDEDDNLISFTDNPSDTNSFFYVSSPVLINISGISGGGIVAASTAAQVKWLIIPAAGAAGSSPNGRRFFIGGVLTYTLNGLDQTIDISPAQIYVRPQPKLVLDYFIPGPVYADDAFTSEVEPAVPFSLGLRVRNAGYGAAQNLKIDAGQPEITENELGLLIGFTILGSEVDGQPVQKSLRVSFGDIKGGYAGTARWWMETTLSGVFTNFTASFNHADEYGGELTSLIDAVYTHELVHNVLVDAGGRDAIRDFLALDDGVYTVYESDNLDMPVSDVSSNAVLSLTGANGTELIYTLTLPETAGALYARTPFGNSDYAHIISVTRDDGKRLAEDNAWFVKTRDMAIDPWDHWFDIFDINGGGTYTVVVDDSAAVPYPPVLAAIGDQATTIGHPSGIDFLVEATDPNGTVPELSYSTLPSGAAFNLSTNGLTTQGHFNWLPGAGQEGIYPVLFTASDGTLSDSERIRIYVGQSGETLDGEGIPVSLAGRSVVITGLVASTTGDAATVYWEAVPGMDYDLYASEASFTNNMPWAPLATNQVAGGTTASLTDATLGTNCMWRYYQVVLGGENPFTNGAWGVIRRDLLPGAYQLMAPPLLNPQQDFSQILGQVLSGHDGGHGDRQGDEVFLYQPDGRWSILYLDASSQWRNASGLATNLNLAEGEGALLLRNSTNQVRVTFTGAVGNEGLEQLVIQPGWNLVSLSAGRALKLSEAFAGAGGGGPHGASTAAAADIIVTWDETGQAHRLMFAQGLGAPLDGHWVDTATMQVEDRQLIPGYPLYYLRREVAGTMTVSF